jgi:hypothetical protein
MADSREKTSAERLLKRASKVVEVLRAKGEDTSDLDARLATAETELAVGRYGEARNLAEEAVVIANALRHRFAVRAAEAKAAEPSPRLLKAIGAEVKRAIADFLTGRKLETRVRQVAGELIEKAAERERAKLEKTAQHLGKQEAEEACRRLDARLDLAARMSALPDESRVRALAEDIAGRMLDENPPPAREEIEEYALDRVRREMGVENLSSGVESATREVVERVLTEGGFVTAQGAHADAAELITAEFSRLLGSEQVEERVVELARAVTDEVVAAAPRLSAEQAAEISRGILEQRLGPELKSALAAHLVSDAFGERVEELAAEVAGGVSEESVQHALAKHLGSKELAARIGEVAGKSLEKRIRGAVSEAREGMLTEKQVQGLSAKVVDEQVPGLIEKALSEIPDGGKVRSIADEVAGQHVSAAVSAALSGVPDESRIRELAGEVARGVAGEVVAGVPRLTAGQAEEIAGRVLSERFGEEVGPALEKHLEGEGLRAKVEELSRAVADEVAEARVGAAVSQVLGGVPDESKVRELADGVVEERVGAAVEDVLGRIPDGDRIRALSGEVFAERVKTALSGLLDSEAFAERVHQLGSGAAEDVVRRRIEAALTEQLESDALAGRIGQLSRDIAGKVLDERFGAEVDAALERHLEGEGLREKVEEVSKRIADEVAERRVNAAVSEALNRVPDESRIRELAGEIAEARASAAVSDALGGVPDEARIRELAADVARGVAGEAVAGAPRLTAEQAEEIAGRVLSERFGAEVGAALEKHLEDGGLRAKVEELSRAVADEVAEARVGAAVSQALGGVPDESRVRELAGGVAEERVGAAVEEVLGRIPDEESLRRIAEGVAADKVGEAVGGVPTEERVRVLAEEVAGRRVDEAIAQALERTPGEAQIRGIADEVAAGRVGDAVAGLPGEDRVRELAAEEAGLKLEESVGDALKSVPDEEQVRTLAGALFAERFGEALNRELESEDFAGRVDERARKIAADLVTERLAEALEGHVGGEELSARVRELSSEVFQQQVSGALTECLESRDFSDRLDELSKESISEQISRTLEGYTNSKGLADRIWEVVRGRVQTEVSMELDQKLDPGKVAALVEKSVGGVLSERMSGALEAYTSSEALAERVREIAGSSAGGEAPSGGGGGLDEEQVREIARGMVRDNILEAISATLRSGPFEERIREIARGAGTGDAGEGGAPAELAEEKIREVASEVFRDSLPGQGLADFIRDMVGKMLEEKGVGTAGAGKGEGEGTAPAGLEDRVLKIEQSFEALPTYLQGTARIYQRLNQLEKSVSRVPGQEHVESQIAELRKQVAGAAEQLSEMPGTLRGMAKDALADTLEHIDRLEAEHSEGRAGEHLRELIRTEIDAAGGGGGGGLDREEVARIVGTLMGTPQFAEKIKALVPKPEPTAAAEPGEELVHSLVMSPELTERIRHVAAEGEGPDLAELRDQIDKQVKEVVADMVNSGELKEQIGGLVEKAAKKIQRVEMTQTRTLRLKDAEAASDPSQVQEAPQATPDEMLQHVVNSDDFKVALDDRFRTMLDYLKSDVIPRAIKKHLKS